MSYLEGPKTRFASIASVIAGGVSSHASHHLKPGCVQCGSLLEITDRKKKSLSGKCYSCENWVSDEDEEVEELEE